VDACVAENRRIAEVLVGERGWPRERVPVIWPCGRPRDQFPAPAARAEVRRRVRSELGLNHDEFVFLTAARMHPQKRPLDLVKLAQRLRGLETVRFLMVGGGDLESEVDAAIAASGGARVQRLGFRSDIPELIVASDVGCLVSQYEGLPVFLLECLQAGRPFLGTAVGDMGDLLKASNAGLVVEEPGDLDDLEACVRRLVDPEEWAAFAERAVATGAHFEVSNCADRYAAAFLGEPVDEPSIG
jgi:glycosyltransferase involved in cell wall biosynthesis